MRGKTRCSVAAPRWSQLPAEPSELYAGILPIYKTNLISDLVDEVGMWFSDCLLEEPFASYGNALAMCCVPSYGPSLIQSPAVALLHFDTCVPKA